jgi:hypothetical protein
VWPVVPLVTVGITPAPLFAFAVNAPVSWSAVTRTSVSGLAAAKSTARCTARASSRTSKTLRSTLLAPVSARWAEESVSSFSTIRKNPSPSFFSTSSAVAVISCRNGLAL